MSPPAALVGTTLYNLTELIVLSFLFPGPSAHQSGKNRCAKDYTKTSQRALIMPPIHCGRSRH